MANIVSRENLAFRERLVRLRLGKHDFDLKTQFCKTCGIARERAVDYLTSCVDGDNVVGISHILSGRKLDELLDRFLGD